MMHFGNGDKLNTKL